MIKYFFALSVFCSSAVFAAPYQEIEAPENPLAEAAGSFGHAFFNRISENIKEEKAEEGIRSLLRRLHSGMSKQEMTKEILSSQDVPWEKRLQLVDVMTTDKE